MAKKIRLTTGQAVVKFLKQQYISVDGEESPFVEGYSIYLVMVMSWVLVKLWKKVQVT